MVIWLTQPTNAVKIAEGVFHFRDGGTSSASPVVAGIAALYLQQNPTATAMQVKNAILQCAVQDTFTGTSLPDNMWGHGKADAFNTLVNCSLTSLSESYSFDDIQIFPNPVYRGETASIQLQSQNTLPGELIISDLLGKEIERIIIPESEKITLNTSIFNAGIYLVTFKENNQFRKTFKLSILNR